MQKLLKLITALTITSLCQQQINASEADQTVRNRKMGTNNSAISEEHNINALFDLGVYYFETKSYEQAFDFLSQAAELDDHPTAQYDLGLLHEFGLGTKKNLTDAATFYTQALANIRIREKTRTDANAALTRVIQKIQNP